MIDKIKRIKLSRLNLSQDDKEFYHLINSCEIKKYKELPHSIVYTKNDKILIEVCNCDIIYLDRDFCEKNNIKYKKYYNKIWFQNFFNLNPKYLDHIMISYKPMRWDKLTEII